MAEIESRFVKRGLWTNLEKGPIMGQTITTDIQTGTYLVALLAVFTSLGLHHLFNIIIFLYHQICADGQPNDGHFRQQQVLLRTLPTPSMLMADSIKLWSVWRHISPLALQRSLKVTFLAGFFTLGSLAASIFSAYVVDSTNIEVLVSSPLCAYVDQRAANLSSTIPDAYKASVLTLASSYAQECYIADSSPTRCGIFTRPRIDFNTEIIPCPFTKKLCSSPAVSFDSGFVDLGETFGLNIAPKHRVKYRKKDTCAILSQEGRVFHSNGSGLQIMAGRKFLPSEEFLLYSYGTIVDSTKWVNTTFGLSLLSSNLTGGYTMAVHAYFSKRQPNTFYPIPELIREDADTLLRFISMSSTVYYEPVNDPMFSAHKPQHRYMTNANRNFTVYLSDSHASILGCIEQYQYCTVHNSKDSCSPLGGVPASLDTSLYPKATSTQLSLINNLIAIGQVYPLSVMGGLLAPVSDTGDTHSLPDDQWINEMRAWEASLWASHQVAIAENAIGPKVRDPAADAFTRQPATEADRALCGIQKMRKSGDFGNINFFGLIFILTISVMITLLDLLMLRFFIGFGRFKRALSPRIDRWLQDTVFQLQRRVYELRGQGDWLRLEKEIPTTMGDTKFPDLSTRTETKTPTGSL